MNGGFMYNVSSLGDGTVRKTPRAPGNTTIEKEKLSEALHRSYLGKVVPETEIVLSKSNGFLVTQEQVNHAEVVDLAKEFTKKDIQDVLESGARMQKENNILFDIFGMQGMINLFNYYFGGTSIKKMSDLLLPINAKYLKLIHNMPPELLIEMNSSTGLSPFLAYNLLRDKNGELNFIDTDYRPLDMIHPLNLVGNWITKKALKDLEYTNNGGIIRI